MFGPGTASAAEDFLRPVKLFFCNHRLVLAGIHLSVKLKLAVVEAVIEQMIQAAKGDFLAFLAAQAELVIGDIGEFRDGVVAGKQQFP
ncbi:MAG: hypothetical protein COT71_00565 [Candidatus Andersenbacteria bacterium CG10_big_fil_rev_8_21_14_0_10_54_11]|uniref:Uncharacterized protein n=1 Tax=Candidatus Andersenbacteria bacterium CG10_big_fil_rev_8_21_14_0_10_54_11 TaxID=1974485 RepID=A0A2M6X057_9BACT|nr:MAG: hypothetical protein COT71_00565 [Candidatus Andersenbacteria bacterium CG10_big_fil_rev_8_21_14_0_10_54_11]